MLDSDWLSTGVNQTTLPGVSKYPDAFVRRTCHRISPHRTAAGNTFPNSHSCKQNTGTQLRIDLLFCIHVEPLRHSVGALMLGVGIKRDTEKFTAEQRHSGRAGPDQLTAVTFSGREKVFVLPPQNTRMRCLVSQNTRMRCGTIRCGGCINDSN